MPSSRPLLLPVFLALVSSLAAAQHEQHAKPRTPSDTVRDTVARRSARVSDGATSGRAASIPADPLVASTQRMGSGTSWPPDESLLYAYMLDIGGWSTMIHGFVFGQYDKQFGPRGDDQLGSINWAMIMATRRLGRGQFQLRGMASLDPWTIGKSGYPLLLQTGETFQGEPLHDRQHPHDLFMELAGIYERQLTPTLAASLYLAAVGEPVAGPVAFSHRPSAFGDPLAPISHHWQDAAHIMFGVVTAGVFTSRVKLEASIFNGRDPDENRSNFDYSGRSLDSYAGRITLNPSTRLSLAASAAYFESPEAEEPDVSMHRYTASALYTRPLRRTGTISSALIVGGNKHEDVKHIEPSMLLESTIETSARNTFFIRAERVRKHLEELGIEPQSAINDEQGIASFAAGYLREIRTGSAGSIGLGVRGALHLMSSDLRRFYTATNGAGAVAGLVLYLRLRPPRMSMSAHTRMMSGSGPHQH